MSSMLVASYPFLGECCQSSVEDRGIAEPVLSPNAALAQFRFRFSHMPRSDASSRCRASGHRFSPDIRLRPGTRIRARVDVYGLRAGSQSDQLTGRSAGPCSRPPPVAAHDITSDAQPQESEKYRYPQHDCSLSRSGQTRSTGAMTASPVESIQPLDDA